MSDPFSFFLFFFKKADSFCSKNAFLFFQQAVADWQLILKKNPPVEPDLFFGALLNSAMLCGIEIRNKSGPDT